MAKPYTRSISKKFGFFNGGTAHFFNPEKPVYEPGKPPATALTYHIKLARFLDRPDVYILDNLGARVPLQ